MPNGSGLPSDFEEYPPLLDPGRHPMTIEQLRDTCVTAFPTSQTRARIMDGFEEVVGRLLVAGVHGEIWVDGSFVTEKKNPNDIDFVLRIQADVDENANEQQREAINFLHEDLRNDLWCHSFVLIEYNEDDPRFWVGEYMRAYWMKQWGFSRDEQTLKGMAVIELLEEPT